MAVKVHHWRGEIAYVLLGALTILALVLYENHINSSLHRADRISCQNRLILIRNQRLVLSALEQNAGQFHFKGCLLCEVAAAQERLRQARPCAR